MYHPHLIALSAKVRPLSKRKPSIVVSIGHAAHVQLFRYLIARWQQRGWSVDVVCRAKPLVKELLQAAHIPYTEISRPGCWYGQGVELLVHHARMLVRLIRHRPNLVISVAGILATPPARLLGIRSAIVYDTEDAVMSNRIAYPFANHVLTPQGYLFDCGKKHTRFPSFHELAYSHPNRFVLNNEVITRYGLDKRPYVVVRFVRHSATHDAGQQGFGETGRARLLDQIMAQGYDLWITSEEKLPARYESMCHWAPGPDILHLLAGARAYIGESPTMAMEAGACGTPAAWVSTRVGKLGYVIEMEHEFGLVRSYRESADFFKDFDFHVLSELASI